MPHLVLEYTTNLPDEPPLDGVLERLHQAITTAGPFDLANVKSRIFRRDLFRVSGGAPERAFVHLGVAVLAGRDPETLRATGNALLAVLQDSFPRAHEEGCEITVEIREMRRELYFKAVPPAAGRRT